MLVGLQRLSYRVAAPLAHAWWGLWRSRHDGVKCVITNAGEAAFVRHTYGDRQRWDFPGGFVRRGEEPLAAAEREMREELGLVIAPAELEHIGAIAHNLGRRRGTVHYYRLEHAARDLDPDPVELAEVAWFAPGALPRPIGEHVARALAWIAAPPPAPATPCVSIGEHQSGESRRG